MPRREDHFTSTLEDAAAFERAHSDAYDDSRDGFSWDVTEEYERRHPRPREVDPYDAQSANASALMVDLLHAFLGPLTGMATNIEVAPPGCELHVSAADRAKVVGWLEASLRWDVLVRDGRIFVRPAGGDVTVGPPF